MSALSHLNLCLISSLLLGLGACAPDIHHSADAGSPAANMVLLAEQMHAKGDLRGAVDFYQRALQKDPKDTVALLELGATLEQLNNPEAAAEQYRKALILTPHDSSLLRSYGRVLLTMGDSTEARNQYEKALREDSDDAKALNGLAIALDNLGEHEKAQKTFVEALSNDKHSPSILNNLAYSFIVSGSYEEAIKLLEPEIKNPAATPAMRQNLALAYGLEGMEADAQRVARMDLPAAKVKANLAYYARKRQELSLAKPYADLGSYPTQVMAEARVFDLKKFDDLENKDLIVTPEITGPGGTPRFTLRLYDKPLTLQIICADLQKEDVACTVRK